ncbi:MAG: hypothetical protein ACQGVK_02760 [Myxococcota bacterium]
MVHPLVQIYPRLGSDQIATLTDETVYVACQTMSFIVPSADHVVFREGTEAFLRYLRAETRQASLPTEVALTGFSEIESLPPLANPGEERAWVLRPDIRDSAATLGLVSEAEFALDFQIPTHVSMLLDAIDALDRGEYRVAVLYAAISVEVLANSRISENFEELRARVPEPKNIRLIKTPDASERFDPVYNRLRASARRSFRGLHYELALYVLGRSLCTDSPELYVEAKRLHETRNQIAHRGAEDPSSSVFATDAPGATAAVHCAVRVFSWYGEPGFAPKAGAV